MRTIVSFTTIPSRIGQLHKTIHSIEDQETRPDVVCLCIADTCRRQKRSEYVIPEFIENNDYVTILRRHVDYGPSMKLLPVLEWEKDPDSIIITIDDDHMYDEHFVGTLLSYSRIFPDCALGFNGWNVTPLIEDNKFEFIDKNLKSPQQADVLEGYRGVLYRRKFFTDDIFEYAQFPKYAHRVDDVWISAHLAKCGVQRLVLPGIFCRENRLPRGLHNSLVFKRMNRRMAIEFQKRGYW